jgi:nucleoside-diphosphate-sugar epimerase
MKALITGATGFIGSHLAERLAASGYDVSCLVRDTSSLKWLDSVNVKLVQGDCCDFMTLKDAVRGNDYIFHLAGLTRTNKIEEFYSVNSRGTENLIKAVFETNPKIKRFVYLSSLAAAGPSINSSPHVETGNPGPISDYGKSKLGGEKYVLKFSSTIPVSILRPSAVYGPRDRQFYLIFKMIKKKIMPYWGKGRTSLIYVDDLIDALFLSIEKESAIGKIYHISDGIKYSNDDIIDGISSVLDTRVIKIKVPRAVLPVIGFFGERISRISGKNSLINSDKIKELKYSDWTCDIDLSRADLNFEPQVRLKEGIKWTADWYRIHKWL